MPKQGKDRANGPYKHGRKWRIVFTGAAGSSETESFETEAEACEARDTHNKVAGGRTVGQAVEEYFKERNYDKTTNYRLLALFRLPDEDRPLHSFTEAIIQKLYAKRVKESAAATHHAEVGYARRFFERQIELGRIAINPCKNIKLVGKKNKGKPKLRVNGTRTMLGVLLKDESMESTAVLMCLTLSLRASAVIKRTVADLDDNGWLLWVRNNKSAAGDLEIEVPAFLRDRLMKLAAGKKATDKLFAGMDRFKLHRESVRFCALAGVDRVTPHGLRGSGATQRVRAGEAIERVAIEIGHADKGITLKGHYLGGGAIESGRARMVEGLVMDAAEGITNQENPEVN